MQLLEEAGLPREVLQVVTGRGPVLGPPLLAGGKRRPDIGPLFYEPTVLTGVTRAIRLYAEETFGPVVALYRFADDADAIARANDARFGLNGSVWSRRTSHALRVPRQLQVGTVNINGPDSRGPDHFPFLGVKDSGSGTQGIHYSIEAMSRSKAITLNLRNPT